MTYFPFHLHTVGTSVRTGVADSSGSRRRLPTLNTQRLRHFICVGWDGADGGLGGLTNSFRCCACQLVQSLAPAPNTHAESSTLLSHMSLQHGGISISPRIEAASAPPAHLNVTRQMAEKRLHAAQFRGQPRVPLVDQATWHGVRACASRFCQVDLPQAN